MFKYGFGWNNRSTNIYCGKKRKRFIGESEEEINERFCYENEPKIEINLSIGDINITSYEGTEIKVVGKSNIGERILIKKNDGKICIDTELNIDKKFCDLDFTECINDINIYIPLTFKGDLDCNLKIGEIKLYDIKGKNLNVKGATGRLNINNIIFDKIFVVAAVGETIIKLKEKFEKIQVEASIGNIEVDFKKVEGELVFNGGIGDAIISIPINSPINFDISHGLGTCKNYAKTSNENIYKFNINVGIGKILIMNN